MLLILTSIDIDDPILWKVSILVNRTFKETISKLDFDGQSLLPMEGLWEVFSESPVPKHLHIVVRAPPAGELYDLSLD